MNCLFASGNPFQIVVLPMLFVVAILATGICLMVCAIALILGIVLASRRPKRQVEDGRDGYSGTPGWD